MNAGTTAADAALQLLEVATDSMTPIQRAQARVARRPGVAAKQRGRAGSASSADDFNAKHSRGGGGVFRKESDSEHTKPEDVQKKLKDAGLYKGAIDGQFGPESQAALKTFQKQNGIEPSGKLDERTKLTLANPPKASRADVVDEEHKLLADKTKGKGSGKAGKAASDAATAGVAGVDASDPASVKAFQEKNGLTVDGVVGPETQAAMRETSKGSSSSRASGGSGSGSSSTGSSAGGLPGGTLRRNLGMDRKRGNGDVKAVQNALQELGFDLGDAGVDGKFGPKTEEAIRKFQQENGLAADGVFGRHTRRLLDLSNSRTHARTGKDNAPLSADEEPLSPKPKKRPANVAVAEAALLIMEAPDAEPPTQAEREELRERHGDVASGVSLKRDKGGVFVHTHRARSKSFKTVAAIPKTVVRFIESTG